MFELARSNLSLLGLDIDLRHGSYQHGLASLGQPGEVLLIVFVAPPWGHALSHGSGLDLRRTQPPVAEVINLTTGALGNHKLLFAIQVYETVEPASLAEVTAQFPWSVLKIYDINAPGQNHGLLLAAWGWAVTLSAARLSPARPPVQPPSTVSDGKLGGERAPTRLIEPESAAVCRSVREARWAGSRTACRSRW